MCAGAEIACSTQTNERAAVAAFLLFFSLINFCASHSLFFFFPRAICESKRRGVPIYKSHEHI